MVFTDFDGKASDYGKGRWSSMSDQGGSCSIFDEAVHVLIMMLGILQCFNTFLPQTVRVQEGVMKIGYAII